MSATPVSNDVINDEVTWSESEAGDKMAGDITCQLEPRDLWDKFHQLGTEMIITKSGRFLINFFYTFLDNYYYCQLCRENRHRENITVSCSLDREQKNNFRRFKAEVFIVLSALTHRNLADPGTTGLTAFCLRHSMSERYRPFAAFAARRINVSYRRDALLLHTTTTTLQLFRDSTLPSNVMTVAYCTNLFS